MDVRFERKTDGTDVWLTPPYLIEELGPFDLDPCFSPPRPWDTAKKHFGRQEDGLALPWSGFVFCNPPYGRETGKWLEKCSLYKNCLCLIFARTETKMFREYVWQKAKAVLFFYGRLAFYRVVGTKAIKGSSAGAPSCLVAWNDEGVQRLERIKDRRGRLVYL